MHLAREGGGHGGDPHPPRCGPRAGPLSPPVLRASALQYVFEHRTIYIGPEELIAMINGLLDFGGNGHLGGYAGGGVGYADVKQFGDSKGKLANQFKLLAGLGHRIRDVRIGPDGFVYVLTDDAGTNGAMLRLEPGK
jgi:hypothetical protein